MEKKSASSFPPAAERLLKILDCFLDDEAILTPKELSEKLDVPLSSLYRILNCLEEYQYIAENPQHTNSYIPGYKLSLFGRQYSTEQQLIQIARPYMQEIVKEVKQACQLTVLTSRGVCIIEQCIPEYVMTYICKLGEICPINISAGGKLLVALLPPSQQAAFLRRAKRTLTAQTEYTITDIDVLKTELRQIRKQKYAIDDQEYAIGIGCCAVPIYRNGQPIAAINITGSYENYKDPDKISSYTQLLNHYAKIIENTSPTTTPLEETSFISSR